MKPKNIRIFSKPGKLFTGIFPAVCFDFFYCLFTGAISLKIFKQFAVTNRIQGVLDGGWDRGSGLSSSRPASIISSNSLVDTVIQF